MLSTSESFVDIYPNQNQIPPKPNQNQIPQTQPQLPPHPTYPPKLPNTIRGAFFDIGKKNFAQYIEEHNLSTIQSIKEEYDALPTNTKKRKLAEGMDASLKAVLEKILLCGTRIQTGVYDLRDDKTSDTLDIKTRINIINHLSSFRELWDTCDEFVIEQQYFKTWSAKSKTNKGTEANVDAIKIAEFVFGWFLGNYPGRTVIYFGSQNKTLVLGAPYGMDKVERKNWSDEKAREIYTLRGDQAMISVFELKDKIFRKRLNTPQLQEKFLAEYPEGLDCKHLAILIVTQKQKLNDVSDTMTQYQAYKIKKYLEETDPGVVKKKVVRKRKVAVKAEPRKTTAAKKAPTTKKSQPLSKLEAVKLAIQ